MNGTMSVLFSSRIAGRLLMAGFFLVSMVGNLASEVAIERVIMAPFALLLAVSSIRLAAAKQPTG